jgi:pyruvate dehydrogenase E1 component
MFADQENVFFYVTCMNENYVHPPLPEGVTAGLIRGMYRLHEAQGGKDKARVQLLGSGAILREVEAAARYLEANHGVAVDVWSITSYSELRRDGIDCERWNTRHPTDAPRMSYVSQCFEGCSGPFIAASDYMRIVPDQIRAWIPGRFTVLGTDGYGRSDSRRALRGHFEVNCDNIVIAALKALCDDGAIEPGIVAGEIENLGLDPDKPNPVSC